MLSRKLTIGEWCQINSQILGRRIWVQVTEGPYGSTYFGKSRSGCNWSWNKLHVLWSTRRKTRPR